MSEIAEWACRTYGWTIEYVLEESPAVRIALMWRCYSQSVGGLRSGTLAEDELAEKLFGTEV